MSSEKNTEVYIPKDACVKAVPLQCLPSSITRKICVRPLLSNSSQMATWICPVELREKGTATCRTAQTHRFLARGQFSLPVVSSNPTASRILRKFLSPGGHSPLAEESDAPAVYSRVSSHRRNTIILYCGQIFLTVLKKTPSSQSQNFKSPFSASQKHLHRGLQEEFECGASHKTTEDANENTQTCRDGEIRDSVQEQPVRRDAACQVREECGREGGIDVVYKEELMKNAEEHPDSDLQADGQQYGDGGGQRLVNDSRKKDDNASGGLQDAVEADSVLGNRVGADVAYDVTAEEHRTGGLSFPAGSCRINLPVITHITSLAEGWAGSAGTVRDEDRAQLMGTVEGSARTPPSSEPSLQENQAEGDRSGFMLPPESLRLDFEDLERQERIMRIRNNVRNMEAKLNMLNCRQ